VWRTEETDAAGRQSVAQLKCLKAQCWHTFYHTFFRKRNTNDWNKLPENVNFISIIMFKWSISYMLSDFSNFLNFFQQCFPTVGWPYMHFAYFCTYLLFNLR